MAQWKAASWMSSSQTSQVYVFIALRFLEGSGFIKRVSRSPFGILLTTLHRPQGMVSLTRSLRRQIEQNPWPHHKKRNTREKLSHCSVQRKHDSGCCASEVSAIITSFRRTSDVIRILVVSNCKYNVTCNAWHKIQILFSGTSVTLQKKDIGRLENKNI